MKKKLVLVGKYLVALAMLAWILNQVETDAIVTIYARLSLPEMLLAFVFFNLGQCLSSERMRHYYRHAGFAMSRGFGLRLTYASMFYNIIIPGGIGGDAYRVALLKRIQAVPVKTGIRLQLSNRMSGLVAICLLILGLAVASSVALPPLPMAGGIALATAALLCGYGFVILPFLKETRAVALRALLWSLLAQGAALGAVVVLCFGLGAGAGQLADYLLLYLVAALAGMVPVTIGGLGIREFTFFYGSQIIAGLGGAVLAPELGVTLALAFFALTFLSSCAGLLFRVPDAHTEEKN